MTNTSRPRLRVTAAALAKGEYSNETTGRRYVRVGSKWRYDGEFAVEPKPRRRSGKSEQPKVAFWLKHAAARPYVDAMTGWQKNQWQGKGRPVDRAHLLFHVCFQKPPKRPLSADEGMALVDRQINLAIARKLGQSGPRLGLDLHGKRIIQDPGTVLRAWKATKDFLARQRQRWMARATRSAQR